MFNNCRIQIMESSIEVKEIIMKWITRVVTSAIPGQESQMRRAAFQPNQEDTRVNGQWFVLTLPSESRVVQPLDQDGQISDEPLAAFYSSRFAHMMMQPMSALTPDGRIIEVDHTNIETSVFKCRVPPRSRNVIDAVFARTLSEVRKS